MQQNNLVALEARPRTEAPCVKAGTLVVRTNQKLGVLAASLLEPQSRYGLVTFNYFDSVQEGEDFPVLRLPANAPLLLAKARPLPGVKTELTVELFDRGEIPDFNGDPVKVRWLEDGEHFLQIKNGQLCKVHAVSGRSEPYAPIPRRSQAPNRSCKS